MGGNSTQSVLETRRPQVPGVLAPFVSGAAGAGTGALGRIQDFTGALLPASREGLLATARGDFLAGGPGFDAAVNASLNAAQPRILSTFGAAGRGTGGLAQTAIQQAAADAVASLFSSERARQQAAQIVPLELERGLLSNASGLTPFLTGADATRSQEFRGDKLTSAIGGTAAGLGLFNALFGDGTGTGGSGSAQGVLGGLGRLGTALGIPAAAKSALDFLGLGNLFGAAPEAAAPGGGLLDFDPSLGGGLTGFDPTLTTGAALGAGALGAGALGLIPAAEAFPNLAPGFLEAAFGFPEAAGAGVPAETLLLGGEGAGGLGLPQVPGAVANAGLPLTSAAGAGGITTGALGLQVAAPGSTIAGIPGLAAPTTALGTAGFVFGVPAALFALGQAHLAGGRAKRAGATAEIEAAQAQIVPFTRSQEALEAISGNELFGIESFFDVLGFAGYAAGEPFAESVDAFTRTLGLQIPADPRRRAAQGFEIGKLMLLAGAEPDVMPIIAGALGGAIPAPLAQRAINEAFARVRARNLPAIQARQAEFSRQEELTELARQAGGD